MDAEERKAHERRLKLLRERAALQGINTPPDITIEIDDIESKLSKARSSIDENASKNLSGNVQGLDLIKYIDSKCKERDVSTIRLRQLYDIKKAILKLARDVDFMYPNLSSEIVDLEKRIKELDTMIDRLISLI